MAYEMMLYPKEKTPQTVPAGNYISDVYAPYAELFDLSLLPNDGEVPLSPQSQLQQSQQQAFGGPAQSPEYIPATIFHDVPAGPMQQMKQEQPSAGWSDSWSISSGYSSCGSIASSNPASPESTASSYGLLDNPHHQPLSSQAAGGGHDRHLLSPYGLDQPPSIKLEYDSGSETSIDLDSLLGGDSSPYHHSQVPSPAVIKVENSGYPLPTAPDQSATAKPQGFQILREHLQDTSFQRRHNLKPLELDSLIGGLTTHADIGPVFEFALQEMKNGVQATCTELGISSDPKQWSTPKVHQWLELAMGKYFLPRLDNLAALFPENGAQLASLPLEEFVRRIPQGGDKLHGYLELWKQIHRLMVGDNTTVDSMVTETTLATGGLPMSTPIPCGSLNAAPVVTTPGFSGMSDANRMIPSGPGSNLGASNSGPTSTHSASPTMLDNFDSDSMTGDASDDEDEDMPPERSGSSSSAGGGPSTSQAAAGQTSPAPAKVRHGGSHIHLWQFLKELLACPEQHQNAIRWIDRSKGVFKIEDSVRVARLWGRRKNRPAMNYDKLSRSIRQYYKKGIMQKTERSQRLVYQFCSPYAL
ncbi:DNA-binding protein D-ETS-4 [Anopheles ziemanni]|uniref:DNA-binding protein D-ETS-4 n=1 Tax=Anopheles coustani TaxID=139045 RepID=UPI0026596FBA|nr:DNA-binding protein D-ETS-4 [Anopheles coustani]XP_058170229.1 DNA-binding protein D-ETS-4 [Anopheles ziemanni]